MPLIIEESNEFSLLTSNGQSLRVPYVARFCTLEIDEKEVPKSGYLIIRSGDNWFKKSESQIIFNGITYYIGSDEVHRLIRYSRLE